MTRAELIAFGIPEEYAAAYLSGSHKKHLIFDAEVMGEMETLMLFGPGSGGAHNVKVFRSELVEHIKADPVAYCQGLLDDYRTERKNNNKVNVNEQIREEEIALARKSFGLSTRSHP